MSKIEQSKKQTQSGKYEILAVGCEPRFAEILNSIAKTKIIDSQTLPSFLSSLENGENQSTALTVLGPSVLLKDLSADCVLALKQSKSLCVTLRRGSASDNSKKNAAENNKDLRVVEAQASFEEIHVDIDDREIQSQLNQLFKIAKKYLKHFNENQVREKTVLADLSLKGQALENSINGFDIVDEKGNFRYVNSAYVRMWGYDSAEEVYGTSPIDHCLDPEIPKKIITLLKQTGVCDIEFEAKRKDGSTFPVRMLAYRSLAPDGSEIYPTSSIDITEIKKTRESQRQQEVYFKELIDTSPAMFWMTDENSQCTYLSQPWYDYTGRTPEQDLGVGWLENLHPEDLPLTRSIYTEAVSARGTLRVDYRLRNQKGEYRWMMDQGHPRIDPGGNFLGYVGTVTDIHDRILAEQRLHDETTRFIRSARASDLGVWYCDLPFEVLEWNEVVKKHFYFSPQDQIRIEDFYSHIHPDDREPTRRAIDYSIGNKTPYDFYYRTVNPLDAKDFKWIRAMGWCDYDSNGKPIRFDGITLDSTQEFLYQEELKSARDEAEKANQLKSLFLANMSHEIRTPLGAILGFTELVRDPSCRPEEMNHYLEIIARNGEQLSIIVNDILDLSKVEAGRMEFEYIPTNPYQLVLDVAGLLDVKAHEKGLRLLVQKKDITASVVFLDPHRSRQILLNLIGNAIKFTQAGTVQVILSQVLDATNNKQYLNFDVIDTGIGIDKASWDLVFLAFVQADGSMTRKFGGTGLGLALSRKLAREMGGDVFISQSLPGQGSVFSLRLPIKEKSYLSEARS